MASLQDTPVQDAYVRRCVEFWKNWASFGPNGDAARTREWHVAITPVLQSCNIPVPAMLFSQSSCLSPESWTFNFSYNQDHLDVNWFVRGASTLYHEARHAEQWYRIAQAIALRELPVPAKFGVLTPIQLQNQSAKPVTAMDISKACSISQTAANHAFAARLAFPAGMKAQTKSWFESVFNSARQHRGEVIKHMYTPGAWNAYENSTPDPMFAQYLNLPEEKDAFEMQSEVVARLGNALRMWH